MRVLVSSLGLRIKVCAPCHLLLAGLQLVTCDMLTGLHPCTLNPDEPPPSDKGTESSLFLTLSRYSNSNKTYRNPVPCADSRELEKPQPSENTATYFHLENDKNYNRIAVMPVLLSKSLDSG